MIIKKKKSIYTYVKYGKIYVHNFQRIAKTINSRKMHNLKLTETYPFTFSRHRQG